MISLILNKAELKEISTLLSCKPVRLGLYYHNQEPLIMYELTDTMVALKPDKPVLNVHVIRYENKPKYLSKQDIIKYISHT